MSEYRFITRACARRDWGCETHAEVEKGNRNDPLFKAFQGRELASCFTTRGSMDRSRDLPKNWPTPGPHALGNLHLKAPAAQRAWLWEDTGERLDSYEELEHVQIYWMVAKGARRRNHSSDLQKSHEDILFDPDDQWLPSKEDYGDLVARHVEAWQSRAEDAIRQAAEAAASHPDELIEVDIDRIAAHVIHEEISDEPSPEVSVGVVETASTRYVSISYRYHDQTVLPEEDAFALALAAFPDDVWPDQVTHPITVGEGFILDPAHCWIFRADLD